MFIVLFISVLKGLSATGILGKITGAIGSLFSGKKGTVRINDKLCLNHIIIIKRHSLREND